MKASEIVNFVMEQRALRKQAQAEEPTSVNAGGEAVPNKSLKKSKKSRPYMGPVMAIVELPQKKVLLDTKAKE